MLLNSNMLKFRFGLIWTLVAMFCIVKLGYRLCNDFDDTPNRGLATYLATCMPEFYKVQGTSSDQDRGLSA